MSSASQKIIQAAAGNATGAGQEEFTTPGTYSWEAPAGVESVSVVCVGGGGGGAAYGRGPGGPGGELRYKNNITVIPGNTYTVVVGSGGTAGPYSPDSANNTWIPSGAGGGGDSYFINTSTVRAHGGEGGKYDSNAPRYGGGYPTVGAGDGGGLGGHANSNSGAGGAGGYNGGGGNTSGRGGTPGLDGQNGGGGGAYGSTSISGEGGGVGLQGQGSNGAGGTSSSPNGGAGSGGSGKNYGGGGRKGYYSGSVRSSSAGASGAVRIIWPGDERQFPSTDTADV